MEHTLGDLHRTILVKVAAARSAVQLLAVCAPFCDPALVTIADDLEEALSAAQQALGLSDQLGKLVR